MISFQRKMALRKQAGGSVAARRKTEALARTGQVARSTVRVGDDDLALDSVLVGAVDEAAAGEARDSDIAFLDESDVDSFDTIIDAGDAADVDSMLDAQDSDPDLIDEFDATAAADEDAHQADMTAIGANRVVTDALAAAEDASELALEAKITADGRNRIYAQALNPVASPDFPFVSGDLWYRTEVVGGVTRFVEVSMWNGAEWKPYQMVASSLLVPGSVGPTLIENGAITTGKLNATAIDGMTITGPLIRTAASGERMQFDAFGLRAFNSLGAVTASLAPVNGQMSLTGVLKLQNGTATPAEVGAFGITSPLFNGQSMHAKHDIGFGHQRRDLPSSFGTQYGNLAASAERIELERRFDNLTGVGRGSFSLRTYDGAELYMSSSASRTATPLSFSIRPDFAGEYYFLSGGPMSFLRFSEGGITVKGPFGFDNDTAWGSLSGSFESSVTSGAADYRIHHGVIYIRLNLTGTFPVGTTDLFSGIPIPLRPPANMFAAAFLTSGNTGTVFSRANGTLGVAHQSGGTRSSVLGTIIYPIS